MNLNDHMHLPLVITLNIDHIIDLTIFKGPLVLLLMDIIIGQLEHIMIDLHLIQVALAIMDIIMVHPIAALIVYTIEGSLRSNLPPLSHFNHGLSSTSSNLRDEQYGSYISPYSHEGN